MPSVSEAAVAPGQLAAGLAAGVNTLDGQQAVTFTQYTQQVLPLDGYIFWINTGVTISVKGSIHQSTERHQNEDEIIDINRLVFTATSEIDEFNLVSPTTLFIGSFNGVQFAFSRREAFYQQADLFHYVGDAVYPALASQLVDNPGNLANADPIVSNSLPVWLTLNQYMPMYPSFLVPDNAVPPYAAVHIDPGSTEALGAAPAFDSKMTHTQLSKERVKVTMYGMNNQQALDFQDYVFQYSVNTDAIGVMNMPIIRDEKRTQAELGVIAMKKSFEIDISYYQTRVNTIARQFILKSVVQYTPRPTKY